MSHNSQTWYEDDKPQSNREDFSTLEVVSQPLRHTDTLKELQSPDGLDPVYLGRARFSQLDAPEATQYSHSPTATHGAFSPALSPLPASSVGGGSSSYLTEKELNAQAQRQGKRICGITAMFFGLLLVLAFVIVAVAIAVPVGLILGRKHMLSSQPISSNASALSTTGVSNNSSLASVAFNDTQGLMHHRVYYQDNTGTIKESSWNSSGKTWYVSNIAIGFAKPKTPLAAIVTGPQDYKFVSIIVVRTPSEN